ncbi:Protein NLP2 [Raphanus sativus]|uniref:Protein NLP2 n=1 Tax=Raphanus sativus TaxID=3726 RepID=A0A6J0KTT1_RAPSA|nr:protein NLP2 [Raphanus sativus]XP_056847881.1 protein NLP2 [Raphanus sativus]XP_056847882.1 protein NLP2 [Raphanus sativus]XP_056847883.1 protein NLP2 [Raphanus sativus]KAJ4880808.1 Protein NLP2 [Raphanus sativus]
MEGGGGGGDGSFLPKSSFSIFPETAMDMDFMEELLFDGCWLETTDGKSLKQITGEPSPSSTNMNGNNNSFLYGYQFAQNPSKDHFSNEEILRKFPPVAPGFLKFKEPINQVPLEQSAAMRSAQGDKFLLEQTEGGRRWWIAPRTSQDPSSSVKHRLFQAIKAIQQDKDFLIQIWVPIQQEGKNFLTTLEQPHFFNPKYSSLKRYRDVSVAYNFLADEDSKESVGLPGRVFLGKLPEWTPDVRFFRSEEYSRIKEAQKCDVRGSLALPVFEIGSGTCLGVLEIVTTTQKMNYKPELENICKALEAVNLRSSANLKSPSKEFQQVYNQFYSAILPEVTDFLTWVCRSHDLPLALTWARCARQGKGGSRHSDENFSECVSTIDSACFVLDENSHHFLVACSEHHLLQGEGIVGKAFKATKLFFVPEVTTFSKTNYPLAHHANISGLHAALAVPLKNKFNGSVEFVLEFFFPKSCLDTEAQQEMLKSLSVTLQQDFRSLNLVIDKELELEVVFPIREELLFSEKPLIDAETGENLKPLEDISQEDSSWISHMIKANEKGKGVSLSWEYQKEEPKEEFMLTSGWDNSNLLSDAEQLHKTSNSGLRPGEKRRTKTEKSIGLEVLRQYFAGSLKDAARNIGVCPTTLKRICRQHGITRWPSRKIKKVGHSLNKLQLVIDSVQGAQGSIQLDSFYTSFPELSSPNVSAGTSIKNTHQSKHLNVQTENGVSPPSSFCSHSSGSSACCSTGANQSSINTANNTITTLMAENASAILKRARSEVRLRTMNHEETKFLCRTMSHKTFSEHHPLLENLPRLPKSHHSKAGGASKVKATFGEAKVRFTLLPTCGYRELQQEIAKRFNIDNNNIATFHLKYLDDDKEWVLLTCEADLEECIDIYRSSQSRTIKISVHEASQAKLRGSFGSTGVGPSL